MKFFGVMVQSLRNGDLVETDATANPEVWNSFKGGHTKNHAGADVVFLGEKFRAHALF